MRGLPKVDSRIPAPGKIPVLKSSQRIRRFRKDGVNLPWEYRFGFRSLVDLLRQGPITAGCCAFWMAVQPRVIVIFIYHWQRMPTVHLVFDSLTTASTSPRVIRRSLAGKSLVWIWNNCFVTNTLLPFSRGFFCSVMQSDCQSHFCSVSWLGKKRSYESNPISGGVPLFGKARRCPSGVPRLLEQARQRTSKYDPHFQNATARAPHGH